jgi:hypothetical protein
MRRACYHPLADTAQYIPDKVLTYLKKRCDGLDGFVALARASLYGRGGGPVRDYADQLARKGT